MGLNLLTFIFTFKAATWRITKAVFDSFWWQLLNKSGMENRFGKCWKIYLKNSHKNVREEFVSWERAYSKFKFLVKRCCLMPEVCFKHTRNGLTNEYEITHGLSLPLDASTVLCYGNSVRPSVRHTQNPCQNSWTDWAGHLNRCYEPTSYCKRVWSLPKWHYLKIWTVGFWQFRCTTCTVNPVWLSQVVDNFTFTAPYRTVSVLVSKTRGQSNLTKSASWGAHSPVRGHPRVSESCTIEFLG